MFKAKSSCYPNADAAWQLSFQINQYGLNKIHVFRNKKINLMEKELLIFVNLPLQMHLQVEKNAIQISQKKNLLCQKEY